MANNLKALAIVLLLSWTVFVLAKPLALKFMSVHDFSNRRNLWMMLASAAFLTPSFWLYAPIAVLLVIRVSRRDSNPPALFLVALTAVPPFTFPIPTIGIGEIVDLNHFRLLAIVLLLPIAVRLWSQVRIQHSFASVRIIDISVLAFFALQMAVQLPNDTFTNVLRFGLRQILDFGLLYYVFSRSIITHSGLREVLAAFSLACVILVPIALFENLRGWLLFQGIGEMWGKPDHGAWLMRGSSLRAQASSGHSLYFGLFMALGFGFALALTRLAGSAIDTARVVFIFWVGLIASFSRAPWLTAFISALVFLLIAPMKASHRWITMVSALVLLVCVMVSPLGGKIIDLLPFVGTVDDFNVVYRQRLATESWNLIWKSPFFGDPLVLRDMEHLRQGDGIIDIVNSYAAVALFYGFIGLALFVLPLLIGLFHSYRIVVVQKSRDEADALVGVSLVCALVGTLFFIATCGYSWHLYAVVGLVVAYISLQRERLLKNRNDNPISIQHRLTLKEN